MRLSIPFKLAVVLVVASVLPLAAAVVLEYHYTSSRHKQATGQQAYENARDAAHTISQSFDSLFIQARKMAANPAVVESLQRGDQNQVVADDQNSVLAGLDPTANKHARVLVADDSILDSMVVVNRDGVPVATSDKAAAENLLELRHKPRNEPSIEFIQENGNQLFGRLFYPIKDNKGTVLGTVCFRVNVSQIIRPTCRNLFANQQKEVAGCTVDVVWKDTIVASTKPDRIQRNFIVPVSEDDEGWALAKVGDEEEKFYGFEEAALPYGGPHLIVVVNEPSSKALEPLQEQLGLLLLFGGGSIGIFFLIGLYISHREVVMPIKQLIRGARKLANGDLTHRVEPHRSHQGLESPRPGTDELDDLANEFNRMADAMMRSQASLEEKVAQRTQALADENKKARAAQAELEKAMAKLRETQANMIQTEKLASLGLLVAGIAHEINNPLSFILNNVSVIERDYRGVMDILMRYRRLRQNDRLNNEELEQVAEMEEDLDVDYLETSIDRIFASTRNGLDRVKTIVVDLKDFSRLEEQEAEQFDVEQALDTTLEMVGYHLVQAGIDVTREYGGLPIVQCSPGRLNQVFLNLIMNAVQAMQEGGTIKLQTYRDGQDAVIKVSDTGCGIATEHLSKIFDPFFTTKRQGEGTGLGLSVSYGIVREYNGTISVASDPGKGTTFTIRLPINGTESSNDSQGETATPGS